MPNDGTYSLSLLKRTILGITSLQGRSRRSEFLYYWIAMLLAGVLIESLAFLLTSLAGLVGLEEPVALIGGVIVELVPLLLFLPVFALFARRLHDQDLSAGGLLIMLPVTGLNLYAIVYLILTGDVPPEWPGWVNAVVIISIIAFFVFAVLPGTKGPNRYGPDPREDDPRAASMTG